MKLLDLTAERREKTGKGAGRQLRREGLVPAVLYGGDGGNASLSVDAKTFTHLLHGGQGEHAIIQLKVENAPELDGPAMIKNVQHDPVIGTVLHADFMRIRLDEKIQTVIPIVVVGRSKGVIDGGLLDHQLRELEIECLALDVPDCVEIDVSNLGIGDSIHVSEIVPPANVEFVTPGDRAVAAVHAPRVVKTAEEEAAEALEAEAAEGEGEGEGEAKEEAKEE